MPRKPRIQKKFSSQEYQMKNESIELKKELVKREVSCRYKYFCDYCDRKFWTKEMYNRHKGSHRQVLSRYIYYDRDMSCPLFNCPKQNLRHVKFQSLKTHIENAVRWPHKSTFGLIPPKNSDKRCQVYFCRRLLGVDGKQIWLMNPFVPK